MDKIIDILAHKWYIDCLVYNIPMSPSDVQDVVEDLLKTKKEAEKEKKMKKYTIEDYKEFCDNVLVAPPIEEFEDGTIDELQWYEENKIHIIIGKHDMEIDYLADAVNEIDYALREMYDAEFGDGEPTTGNTVKKDEKYRDATWKDILRLDIMREVWNDYSLKDAIQMTVVGFSPSSFADCMEFISTPGFSNDEFNANFFRLSPIGLGNLFSKDARMKAIREMLCSNVEIEELIDKDGKHADKTVITDYSISPTGDLVGWHYGVDFDKDSEENQYYINEYIKEMMR